MRFTAFLLAAILLVAVLVNNTLLVNAEQNCKDVLLVFARGSGQNYYHDNLDNLDDENRFGKDEAQSYEFFKNISSRLQNTTIEKVSLHDFAGRYNQYGYKAVSVADGMTQNATHRKDAGNLYYESVKDGAEELAWYLQDKLTSCPLQQVVLGGYSQGAQVVGEALGIIPAQFRARIAYTALYGDPKFNSRLAGSPTINTGYWVRGSANGLQTGSLGARLNYVPSGLANIGSWCDKEDPVCSARYALKNPATRFLADFFSNHVHSTVYQEKWIPQSANEITSILKSRLPSGSTKTQVWLNKNDKSYQMDIALVLDGSGSMVNQLANIKAKLSAFVTSLYGVNWDTRVAVVAYDDDPAIHAAYLSKVLAGFTTDRAAITKAINDFTVDTYPHDIQEAMYSGIMTAFNDLQWRNGAQKKTIVITDAPAKDPDPGPQHWTKAQVAARALELDPVAVSFVSLPAANQYQSWLDRTTSYLATQTNGSVKYGTYSYSVSDITTLLDTITYQPVAILDGDTTGYINEPVTLTAGNSYDPDGSIASYAWDCANDGVFEAITTDPNYNCEYKKPYSGYVVMQVNAQDGGSAKAILHVDISSRTAIKPAAPEAPILTTERLSETTGKIIVANNYPVGTKIVRYDADNNILDTYDTGTEININNIDALETSVLFTALNENGESSVAAAIIPEYVAPPIIEPPIPPVITDPINPNPTNPPTEPEEPTATNPPAETPKVLPEPESNPQWLLDLTAQQQTELTKRLAASAAATAALPQTTTSTVPQQINDGQSPQIQNTQVPTTQVAGITTKTPDVTAKVTQTTYVHQSPELTILITALILFGIGFILLIWRLHKR